MNERQKKILKILSEKEKASVQLLSDKLDVSGVTIRQDLTFLEDQGLLKRIHGAAVLKDSDDITIRMGMNYDIKLKIAKKASDYVREGDTVFIESGSVNVLLARELLKKGDITIITSNAYVARQFRSITDIQIILIGGLYQSVSESMVGRLAKTCIDQLNFSMAFVGIDGYSLTSGFTSRDILRAEISEYLIHKSPESFILSDSTKFGKSELSVISQPGEVDHVITDTNLPKEYVNHFETLPTDLILV